MSNKKAIVSIPKHPTIEEFLKLKKRVEDIESRLAFPHPIPVNPHSPTKWAPAEWEPCYEPTYYPPAYQPTFKPYVYTNTGPAWKFN